MSLTTLEQLPSHSRLWAFTSGEPLGAELRAEIEKEVEHFLESWKAHGADLFAAAAFLHDRFLLIAVDQEKSSPSGCSIDALTRFLRDLGSRHGVDFLDAPNCCWRDDDGVHCVDRDQFRRLAEHGAVDKETTVFDLTVTSLADLRDGKFETDVDGTWYGRAFPIEVSPTATR